MPTELILALAPSTDGTIRARPRARGRGRPHRARRQSRGRHPDRPQPRDPRGLATPRSCGSTRTPSSSPSTPARRWQTLDRVRAANVGGVMRADGRTPFQRAVARAYNSPVGLGGGAYHGGAEEGEAESAYLGRAAPGRARRGRPVRRDDPPRRGLGAQSAHPPRRLPRVVRPDALGDLLATRELDPPHPPVLGDGPVAR